jgi:hypothetical protein
MLMSSTMATVIAVWTLLCLADALTTTTNSRETVVVESRSRRGTLASLSGLASGCIVGPRWLLDRSDSAVAHAAFPPGPLDRKERRQLDLCLVNLLRLQYWATSLSERMKTLESEDERKQAYLEARLGSKVMVAESKKISGGANANVFMLRSLQM